MFHFKNFKRYKRPSDLLISQKVKEDLTPEDIFFDAASSKKEENETKLEISVTTLWTTRIFFTIIFCSLAFLAFYTLYLFIYKGHEYSIFARRNAFESYEVGQSRGDIISSNGEILATSSSVFDIRVNPATLSKEEVFFIASNISKKLPVYSFDYLYNRIGIAQEKNSGEFVFLKNLNQHEVNSLSSVIEKYNSLSLVEHPIRIYPQGSVFSHILGFTSLVGPDDLKKFPDYDASDIIGKKGIEYYFESKLRGIKGVFAKFVTARGNIVKEELVNKAEKGSTLELTVDSDLQITTHKFLSEALQTQGLSRGAAVVLNPKTGAILALVSLPDFNPNNFTKGLTNKEADIYFNNSSNPLFNRVTSGEYATGSIIKPIIAAAALTEGVIDSNKVLYTQGYISVPSVYDSSVVYRFDDWKNHGAVDMKKALAVSSNVYFYTIGGGYKDQKGLGIDKIAEYLKKFGWGDRLGINFAQEAMGFVPTSSWKKEVKKESWQIGDTYNISIGQGDILATPLQVAASMAVFANEGKLIKPYLIKKIYSQGGVVEETLQGDIMRENFIPRFVIDTVRGGMREAVISGSSVYLSQLPVSSAGKTGTAQTTKGPENAWFMGFMPYENPEIAVTVLLEEGITSNNAVHVAYNIFDWYIKNRK